MIARLEAALARPLPGARAHTLLAPRPRRDWPAGFNPARIRHAAGLLLIVPGNSRRTSLPALGPHPQRVLTPMPHLGAAHPRLGMAAGAAHVVLTVRADRVRHGGQVSLPGGVVEPGETFEQAALREAHEEIGLRVADVRVLGALSPVDIPISGFRLHPFVAAASRRLVLKPADGEVARILEVDVDALIDPARVAWRTLTREGAVVQVPMIAAGGAEIWGATAMVLAEFLTLLGWTRPQRYGQSNRSEPLRPLRPLR